MLLIGMLDSPFVRRVAVSAELLGMKFEHRNWSVGKDFDLIRQYNPLGRVPTLVLPDGEALLESSAILDYLDELAGPERALVPRSGKERRDVLRLMAVASGAAEKGVLQIYERVFRPAEKRHAAWVERCLQQVQGGLRELDRAAAARAGEWLVGDRMTQADVTTACVFTFLCEALGRAPVDAEALSSLGSLAARCEALPAFRALRANFSAP